MYVYFKVSEGNIQVEAVVYRSRIKIGQGYLDHTADVVWFITPERIEWVKDRWEEQFKDTARQYAYAFIQDVTNGMNRFVNALCIAHGLKVEDPSGTTRVPYSEDTSG